MCAKCGWKKNDHVRAAPDAEPPAPKRPMSIKINAPPQPCADFKLDLVGDTFGACVHCGFAKKDHQGHTNQKSAVQQSLQSKWAHLH